MNLVARMSEIGNDEDAGKKGAETCPQRHVEHLFCRRRSSCRLQPSEAEEHFCYALLHKACLKAALQHPYSFFFLEAEREEARVSY